MNTAQDSKTIASVMQSLRDGTLIPRPEFQRRAVWTNKDKINFIETILLGFPFPEIYVATGEVDTAAARTTDLLVDGQQRVTTIRAYIDGQKPFSRRGRINRYVDLSEDEKKQFLSYSISVRRFNISEDEEIRAVFQRMNSTSYSLNEMERFNAEYLGEFKSFCEELAQDDFFIKFRIFSAADIRRMKDISYVASLTATMMSDYFNRDDEIENFLERYNEEFRQKDAIEKRFRKCFELIDAFELEATNRVFGKAEFYTLFIELDRVVNREGLEIDPKATSLKLRTFFDLIDELKTKAEDPNYRPADERASSYYASTLQSTNDRSTRKNRGEIIRSVIVD